MNTAVVSKEAQIVKREEPHALPQGASDSRALMALIERLATSEACDLDRIEKLLALKERWDANEARKAYVAAMAQFKAYSPKIVKDNHVAYQNNKGGMTEYDHATLGALCAAVIDGLAKVGISHSWEYSQSEGQVKVTCILTHSLGHSDRVSLHAKHDDSGGKNAIQSLGSAITYLERYTLLGATGLAPMNDDDGRDTDRRSEKITERQVIDLHALITKGGGDLVKALRFLKVSALTEIPAKNYEAVVQQIRGVNAAKARAKSAT